MLPTDFTPKPPTKKKKKKPKTRTRSSRSTATYVPSPVHQENNVMRFLSIPSRPETNSSGGIFNPDATLDTSRVSDTRDVIEPFDQVMRRPRQYTTYDYVPHNPEGWNDGWAALASLALRNKIEELRERGIV